VSSLPPNNGMQLTDLSLRGGPNRRRKDIQSS
jgi:hypothetical protein